MDAPISQLLLTTAHRLAIEMSHALVFEHVSTMGLIAAQIIGKEPCSPRDLAAALGCSRPAATQLVDRLEREGLVERLPDPHDGRAKVLRLTERGRQHVGLAAQAFEGTMEQFTTQFTREEHETLRSLLAKLERGADYHRGMEMWIRAGMPEGKRPKRLAVHVR